MDMMMEEVVAVADEDVKKWNMERSAVLLKVGATLSGAVPQKHDVCKCACVLD